MANNLLWESPLKVLLSSQKLLCHKNTALVIVTPRMNRAYLNFKHQFNNVLQTESLKFKNIQSKSYRNTSKVMHFGKAYFDPCTFHYSLVIAFMT